MHSLFFLFTIIKKPSAIFLFILLGCQLVSGSSDGRTAPVTEIDADVYDAGTQETTQFGVKINNTDSLTAGDRGPTLLEDFMMREKVMNFGKKNKKKYPLFSCRANEIPFYYNPHRS